MVAKSRLTLRAIRAPLIDTVGHVVPKVVPDSLQVAPLGSACFTRYCPACRQFRGFLAGQTTDRKISDNLLQSQYRAPISSQFIAHMRETQTTRVGYSRAIGMRQCGKSLVC